MDYEKKYKELIKALQNARNDEAKKGYTFCSVIDNIVQELAESEDEKIRKWIYQLLEELSNGENSSEKELMIIKAQEWLEKQGEHKPADKTESKFNEGDWVVSIDGNDVDCISRISNRFYHFVSRDCGIISDINQDYHLWTIDDAKDGDVLMIESGRRNNECLFIFKDIAGREVIEHCYYRTIDSTFSPTGSFIGYIDNVYHPATKKQRDLLFQKMKEEGYEWDAEKKELRKIEQKPEWSEEDEKMLTSILRDVRYGEQLDKLQYDWLKSLRHQKQCAITEEELSIAKKDAYNTALDKIEYSSGEPTFDDGWSAAVSFFRKKNVVHKKQWKPSEEQIEAVEKALSLAKNCGEEYSFDLRTLLEQLKAL